ncbi:hypothetical protein GCM10018966_021460 [Streptomyces yanii]
MTPTLTVSDDVRTLAPGFTHLAVEARGLVNGTSNEAVRPCWTMPPDGSSNGSTAGPARGPRVAARQAAYAAFGAEPSRTRNSAEALAGRAVTEAGLPRINLLADAYDAISVAHPVPVGR